MQLSLANGFYESSSLPVSAQACVNLYPATPEQEALSDVVLFGTPGLDQKLTTGSTSDNVNRGAHNFKDVPYFVNGTTLYKVDIKNNATPIGTVEGTKRVSIADNGNQMMILVPGGKGYIFDGGTFYEITDEGFRANGDPQFVVFIDGYFICSTSNKKFIASAIGNGASWNSLDVGSAEADPDAITAPVVMNNQLYIIGTRTIESFANQPRGADFPFVRSGVFADKGSKSPYSIVKANSAIYFVGGSDEETPAVWRYTGGTPEKISTRPIDNLLQSLTRVEIENIFAWYYAQKGHYFIGFTLVDTTIVYDISEGKWHERKSTVTFPAGDKSTTRCRINSVVPAYGKLLCGDFIDGRIGELDIDIYSEYGAEIIRRRSTQPFVNEMRSFTVPMIELTMESGVGNSDTEDPKVTLQRSLDGKTYSQPRERTIGAIGSFNTRQIWYKNGRASRFEVFAFQTAAKCKIVMVRLDANVIPGLK